MFMETEFKDSGRGGVLPHPSVLERGLLLSAGWHIRCFDLRLEFLGAFSRVLCTPVCCFTPFILSGLLEALFSGV